MARVPMAMTREESAYTMRLNRFLARSGVASRRKSDELIARGWCTVNGEVVDSLGASVDPQRDTIEYAGQLVCLPVECEYIVLNKPAGCVVTRSDTHGRPTVFDLLGSQRLGTMPVGRLDMDTTGLLLWTDDGELAFRLLHRVTSWTKCPARPWCGGGRVRKSCRHCERGSNWTMVQRRLHRSKSYAAKVVVTR